MERRPYVDWQTGAFSGTGGVRGGMDDDDGGFDVARAEREEMYPMTGYSLVRVEYEKPPGEALTKIAHYGRLSNVEMPADSPMTTYVVYDEDGNAYDRDDVEESSGTI